MKKEKKNRNACAELADLAQGDGQLIEQNTSVLFGNEPKFLMKGEQLQSRSKALLQNPGKNVQTA